MICSSSSFRCRAVEILEIFELAPKVIFLSRLEAFSPLSRQEEKTLREALNISLRRIPLDGTTSEDDCDDCDDDLQQEVDDESFNRKEMITN